MCTVDSVDGANDLMQEKEKTKLFGALCRKCSTIKASIILQGKFPYCRDCFILLARHKFYAALGKSKIVRANDKILIACSGNSSSLALLHLVKEGLHESRKKKIISEAVVLFIDEGPVVGLSKDEKQHIIGSIIKYAEQFNFEFVVTSINCVDGDLNIYNKNDLNLFFEKTENEAFKYLDTIGSLTSKEDLLLKLRKHLLVKVARKLNCNKIFTAECSDRCAINLLTNIALGRGTQLPQDVGFSDNKYNNVTIIRPMKDWSRKEVAFYNVFNNLNCITYQRLGTLGSSTLSIQKLTEKFVTDLQESFPSTVSTVLRIGVKIEPRPSISRMESCALCQGNLDIPNESLSALQSSKLSHTVSTLGPSRLSITPPQIFTRSCQNRGKEKCCNSSCDDEIKITTDELLQNICYGCNLILRDMSSVENLPVGILQEIQRRIQLEKMKDDIKDFLL